MNHRKLKAVIVIIVGLLLGYLVATQLNGFLGIEFVAKDLPQEVVPDAVTPAQPVRSLTPIAAIVLPAGAQQDDLLGHFRVGQRRAGQAIDARTGRLPLAETKEGAADAETEQGQAHNQEGEVGRTAPRQGAVSAHFRGGAWPLPMPPR